MGYNELVATQCEGLLVAARMLLMAPRSTNQIQQKGGWKQLVPCRKDSHKKMHGGCLYKPRLGFFVLFSRIQTPFV